MRNGDDCGSKAIPQGMFNPGALTNPGIAALLGLRPWQDNQGDKDVQQQ